MTAKAGTAYVDIQGDFTSLNKQVSAALTPLTSKFSSLGKAAGAGLAGIGLAGVAAGKALYDIGEQFDDAYDTIRVRTGATGKELEGLKGDFKEVVQTVPTDFDTASKAIAGLNQRLGLTGEPLQKLSEQMLELSRITETDVEANIQSVTRVFGDWGVAVKDQGPKLDELFRASQATGIEVSTLATQMTKFGAPLRQMGFGFEETAGLLSKFEDEGVNAELVMGSMRIALGKMASEGVKDPAKALQMITEKIKNAGTAGEANAMALETFGARAGPDMAAAIREGRFQLGDLFDTIKNGDDTVMKAGKQTQDFSEKWQLFKNKVMVALEPVAVRVFDAIGKGLDLITKHSDVAIPALAALAAAIGVAVTAQIALNLAVLANPYVAAVAGLAALAAAFVVAYKKSEEFRAVVDYVFSGLKEMVQGTLESIRGVIDIFAGLFTGDFSRMWDGIKHTFQGALKTILGYLRHTFGPAKDLAVKIAQGVIAGFNLIKRIVGDIAGFLANGVAKIAGFLERFRGAAGRVGNAIVGAFGVVRDVVGKIAGFLGEAVSRVAGFVGRMAAAAARVGGAIVSGIADAVKGLPGAIGDALSGLGDFVANIGGDLVQWINDHTLFGNNIHLSIPLGPDINIDIPALAGGVRNFAGGLALVGEEGPELVQLPHGADVFPHGRSVSMMRAGTAPAPVADWGNGLTLQADIYIGGERIDERVESRVAVAQRGTRVHLRAGRAG